MFGMEMVVFGAIFFVIGCLCGMIAMVLLAMTLTSDYRHYFD